MLNRLSRLAVTRPKAVLAATLVLMVAAGAYGSGISDRLSGGGFYSVSSESQRAAALLEQRFHVGKPNLLVLATDTGGLGEGVPLARPWHNGAVIANWRRIDAEHHGTQENLWI